MKSKVRIIVRNTTQILFECDPTHVDLAYEKAAEFEEMGLDVVVQVPTVNQTLADSLGVSGAAMEEFEQSMTDELDDHDGSCCFTDSGDKIVH